MIILPSTRRDLGLASLSSAVKNFTHFLGSAPRYLVVSETDQILADELTYGGDIVVLCLVALPPKVWMLCSPKGVYINEKKES